MRLHAHNLLACLKCQSFPLEIGPNAVIAPTGDEFDEDFTKRMVPRLDYKILVGAYTALQRQHPAVLGAHPIPQTAEEIDPANTQQLQAIYYAMSQVAIKTATLHCAHCNSIYNVVDFIPVMLPAADSRK
jgi:uncharacterized protein YbaR (Trm112 family)